MPVADDDSHVSVNYGQSEMLDAEMAGSGIVSPDELMRRRMDKGGLGSGLEPEVEPSTDGRSVRA